MKMVKGGKNETKIREKSKPLLTAMLIASALVIIAPALAVQPQFTATITITGNPEIKVGETTTLTAVWITNRDVTRYEWSVDSTGQGIVQIEGAIEGSATFDFSSETPGTFTISFRIWHHQQTDRDATESVEVVVNPVECVEYAYESAFAYGGEDYANDFRDNGFSRWGWTNGPLEPGTYEFELWAAAGQSITSKGVLVGTVSISYIDGDGELSWTVTVNSPYILENEDGEVEVHVYVGNEMFPSLPNGEFTVAPGQYGNTGASGRVSGLSGTVYVIVHAIVGIPK